MCDDCVDADDDDEEEEEEQEEEEETSDFVVVHAAGLEGLVVCCGKASRFVFVQAGLQAGIVWNSCEVVMRPVVVGSHSRPAVVGNHSRFALAGSHSKPNSRLSSSVCCLQITLPACWLAGDEA